RSPSGSSASTSCPKKTGSPCSGPGASSGSCPTPCSSPSSSPASRGCSSRWTRPLPRSRRSPRASTTSTPSRLSSWSAGSRTWKRRPRTWRSRDGRHCGRGHCGGRYCDLGARGGPVTLRVELVVPEGEIWAGNAEMVIAKTLDGDIGVLTGHKPVLGILAEGSLVRIRPEGGAGSDGGSGGSGGGEVVAAVYGGFFSVADDRVSVLARD